MYVKHMKKSEWLDCQRNEFFPKQKGIPSLVKIEHKNTATLDSARSKKKSKVAVLQLIICVYQIYPVLVMFTYVPLRLLSVIIHLLRRYIFQKLLLA